MLALLGAALLGWLASLATVLAWERHDQARPVGAIVVLVPCTIPVVAGVRFTVNAAAATTTVSCVVRSVVPVAAPRTVSV